MKQKNAKRRAAAAVAVGAVSLALTASVFAAVKGDVNGDGRLDIADAVAFAKYLGRSAQQRSSPIRGIIRKRRSVTARSCQ